ncbi:hypothetical protein AAHC03_04805 [Spirometra sp. Aus1]
MMNMEINPEFLDIEAEFMKNLNFLLVQKKNGFMKRETQSANRFHIRAQGDFADNSERILPEVLNKTDEISRPTPSLDTIPSKIEPCTVRTTHLGSIPEEQSSLTESGFETSENSQTELSANVKEKTKLFHSVSLHETRSAFSVFDENTPPANTLAVSPPKRLPISTRNRGSRVQSLANTFEQICSNIQETRPARFKTTPASMGDQDPTSIGNGPSCLPERRPSKLEILRSDISDMQASAETCHRCHKIVYPIDRASTGKHVYHQFCLRCVVCDRSLTSSNFESSNGSIFCRPHFLEKVRNITRSNSSLSSPSYRGPLAGQESDLYTPLVFGSDKCLQPPAVRLM